MAAQAWTVYTKALKKIGTGTITMGAACRIVLAGSASNAISSDLSLLGSLTDEVTEGNGYSSSGKALTTEAWTVSGSAVKFDADDPVFSASGGAINSIKYAVLVMSGASAGAMHALARCSLTSSAFNLSSGNTLTIQLNSGGIFTLANA